jgi:hypothetical protein
MPLVTEPALADHVTAVLKFSVPATEALHWAVWSSVISDELQETITEVMVGGGVTATVVLPNLAVFCVDVAVTVTLAAALGAVRRPDELIVPALALQVTAEL